MSGDDQHYLAAALIGGFGIVRAGKPLRKAQIVVRELASGEVHPATAEDVAYRRALYRLSAPGPGLDPDIVDKLWTPVERDLPAMVERLAAAALDADDPEKWIWYAAMAGVRHPTAFHALATHHQQTRGEPKPVGDQLQVMRVEALLNGQKAMHQWRWRVLHSPSDGLASSCQTEAGTSFASPATRCMGCGSRSGLASASSGTSTIFACHRGKIRSRSTGS